MYPQSMLRAKKERKISKLHLKIFIFTAVKNCSILHWCVCVINQMCVQIPAVVKATWIKMLLDNSFMLC